MHSYSSPVFWQISLHNLSLLICNLLLRADAFPKHTEYTPCIPAHWHLHMLVYQRLEEETHSCDTVGHCSQELRVRSDSRAKQTSCNISAGAVSPSVSLPAMLFHPFSPPASARVCLHGLTQPARLAVGCFPHSWGWFPAGLLARIGFLGCQLHASANRR